MNTHITAARTL